MTAYTPNTGGTVNYDTLTTPSTNATLDTYTISAGTTLLIDTDTYCCANHSTAAGSLDTISFSGIGGTVLIDGTNVWVVPYTGGTGNVPAIGQTITQVTQTSSGYLLGVWSGWQAEPTAVGAAMPATGWIKIRAFTGSDFDGTNNIQANGVTIAVGAGAQVRGWIEVRGPDTGTVTVPRVGKFQVTGDWFVLGTTSGARGQVLTCPTTATVAGVFPGVQIETSSGSGVFEWYASAGTLAASASIPTDSTRGKIFWQTTSGIRIGSDGTNNVGYLPASGCIVRIPNVIFTCCTRAAGPGSGPRVLPNVTLGTRHEFVTTNSGDIQLDKCVMPWYLNLVQPYNVALTSSAINDTIVITEQSTALNIDDCVVAQTQAQINSAMTLTSCFAGGTVSNNFFSRVSLASSGAYVCTTNFISNVLFTDNKYQTFANRANATTGGNIANNTVDCVWHNSTVISGRFAHTTCTNPTYTGVHTYADTFTGTTGSGNPMYFTLVANSSGFRWTASAVFPVTNTHPYSGLWSLSSCTNSTMYGVGTYASKLDLGSANATGVILNSAGNNAGINLKRVYTTNSRTGLWALTNTDTNLVVESVFADYADSIAGTALTMKVRGCGATPGVTGQAAIYGTHWHDVFTSTTAGRLIIACNEPTATTADQCTTPTGSGKFNSSGSVLLTVLNDTVTWTTPDYVTGYTAFTVSAPTVTATNSANHILEYKIDQGSGYSASWANLVYARTGGGGTNGSTNVTMTSTTGVAVNDYVFGTNVGVAARVSSITNGTTVVVTVANTGTVSGTLTFNHLPFETIADPVVGFKLQVRATCTTASATNALTFIRMDMTTTDVVQGANVYPLELVDVTLTGLQNPTEVRVFEAGTTNELVGSETITSGSFTFSVESGQEVDIAVLSLGYQNLRLLTYSTTDDSEIPIQQQVDRQYFNP